MRSSRGSKLRQALRIASALGLSGACWAGAMQGAALQAVATLPKPSILIILVDDWGYSDLSEVRADDSPWNDLPVIDALAKKGLAWNHFYSQPLCNQTRQSLLFGRYEGQASMAVCGPPSKSTPSAQTPTIASQLKPLGYRTAVFGKWHVGPNPNPEEAWERVPAAYGFDQWQAFNASNLDGHCGSKSYSKWQRIDDGKAAMSAEYHTQAVAQAATNWWRETPGQKFAYVCFQAAHAPFHVPPKELLPDGYPAPKKRRDKYEAMLVAMDSLIGDLLAAVDLESTYVFLLADNGTPALARSREDQLRTRLKGSVYQGGVHVPLIALGPGIRVGETNALGHVVDLMSTVGELAGAQLPGDQDLDSISLVPILFNARPSVRSELITEVITFEYSQGNQKSTKLRRDIAVYYESPKSGHVLKSLWTHPPNMDPKLPFERSTFDLSIDPGEARSILPDKAQHAFEFQKLEELYQAYVAERPWSPGPKN